jgi:mono/diheme cytochrome c family protein
MRKSLPAIFLAASIFCHVSHTASQTPATTVSNTSLHAGQEIFTHKCFQCHSVVEGQVRFGPSLYHEVKGPQPKMTPSEIRGILKTGKGKMPSFQESLTKEDVDNLLAYIRSL